jgi:hypothetical protein
MIDDLIAKLSRSREPARSSARESAVDRLIELASDEKPAAKPAAMPAAEMLALDEPKDADPNAMWKALLQLKSVIPYVSRLLPLLDARLLPLLDLIGLGHGQNTGLSKELRENVTGIQTGQRELRVAVQDQALEIKRLEDQLSRLREATEKNNFEHAELVEDVKSIGSLIRAVGAGLAILLVVLILMVGALLAHVGR